MTRLLPRLQRIASDDWPWASEVLELTFTRKRDATGFHPKRASAAFASRSRRDGTRRIYANSSDSAKAYLRAAWLLCRWSKGQD